MAKGIWPTTTLRMSQSFDLEGQALGLLGYGAIGKNLARIGETFDMRVMGFRRAQVRKSKDKFTAKVFLSDELEPFLKEVDVLISSLPLTPLTKGIINDHTLNYVKNGIYVVIIGRAEVFEEKSLYNAVKAGKVAGLAMDPQYIYPRSSTSDTALSNYPFYELPDVLLSPHRAWASLNSTTRIEKFIATQLDLTATGMITNNAFTDISRGY